VITKSEMIPAMLAACPSFAPAWADFLRQWEDDPDPPLYVALGELAGHLVAMLERGEVASLEAVFGVVEGWLVSGDAYVREAATVGLLENLQNTGLHTSTSPEQFLPYLGPQSARWWSEVEAFWVRDIRARR
jgi:hypothetical protein